MKRNPLKNVKWTGEKIVAVIFVVGIFGLGLVTGGLSHRTIARRAWNEYRRDSGGDSRVWARLRRAANTVESNFSETMGRRFFLAGLDTNLRFFLTGELASQEVLLGRDNWLFYKTKVYGDPIADYRGTNPFRERELDIIHEQFRRLQQHLLARGIRLVVMMLPNKEQIYDPFMPDSIRRVNEQRRVDLLVEDLQKRGDLVVVYPKKELMEFRDRYPLYYKHDTHWNELGAWIAAQQLLDRLYGHRLFLDDQQIDAAPAAVHDLADIIGMAWYFDDDQEYRVRRDEGEAAFPRTDRLLFIGDSFQDALKPILPAYLAHATFVHREKYEASLLDEVRPDIVVLEYAERLLDYLLKEDHLWQAGRAEESR